MVSLMQSRLRPVFSVIAGLALTALLMAISGYNVPEALSALWIGATGIVTGAALGVNQIPLGSNAHLDTFILAQALSQVTPLLLTGLAVAIGLRAGLFNIGAQGQMTVGALATAAAGIAGAGFPPVIHVTIALAAGMAAGALWGAPVGFLKGVRGVHEVLTTIMLNYVAEDITSYLVTHNLKDPTDMAPQTRLIANSAHLPLLIARSNLSAGILIALPMALCASLIVRKTAIGIRIRTVGHSPVAARTAGINVPGTYTLTMAICGALAGLAGAIQVLGIQYRFTVGTAANYGFDGIAVALLAGEGGLALSISALFFGALAGGVSYLQLQTNVPDSIGRIVQAVVILFAGMRLIPRIKPIPSTPSESKESPVAEPITG